MLNFRALFPPSPSLHYRPSSRLRSSPCLRARSHTRHCPCLGPRPVPVPAIVTVPVPVCVPTLVSVRIRSFPSLNLVLTFLQLACTGTEPCKSSCCLPASITLYLVCGIKVPAVIQTILSPKTCYVRFLHHTLGSPLQKPCVASTRASLEIKRSFSLCWAPGFRGSAVSSAQKAREGRARVWIGALRNPHAHPLDASFGWSSPAPCPLRAELLMDISIVFVVLRLAFRPRPPPVHFRSPSFTSAARAAARPRGSAVSLCVGRIFHRLQRVISVAYSRSFVSKTKHKIRQNVTRARSPPERSMYRPGMFVHCPLRDTVWSAMPRCFCRNAKCSAVTS